MKMKRIKIYDMKCKQHDMPIVPYTVTLKASEREAGESGYSSGRNSLSICRDKTGLTSVSLSCFDRIGWVDVIWGRTVEKVNRWTAGADIRALRCLWARQWWGWAGWGLQLPPLSQWWFASEISNQNTHHAITCHADATSATTNTIQGGGGVCLYMKWLLHPLQGCAMLKKTHEMPHDQMPEKGPNRNETCHSITSNYDPLKKLAIFHLHNFKDYFCWVVIGFCSNV